MNEGKKKFKETETDVQTHMKNIILTKLQSTTTKHFSTEVYLDFLCP